MRKPPNGSSRFDTFGGENSPTNFDVIAKGGRFMCCHRMTEDGYHRECGGWYAKYGRHRNKTTEKSNGETGNPR
jgi:hypothetical protein